MLRQIIILIVCLLTSKKMDAQSIEIVYNPDYATIQFVKKLLDAGPSQEKTLFYKLQGFDLTRIHFLDSLRIEGLNYNFRYADYPVGQKMNLSFARLLEKYIVEQTPTTPFKKNAEGIFPDEYVKQYERMLELFRPVYEEIVGKPYANKIQLAIQLINKEKTEHRAEEVLKSIARFYGVEMKDYKVMIYPFLDNYHTFGTSFLNMAEVSLPIRSFEMRQAVVTAVHEISHLYYSEISNQFKRRIDYEANNSTHTTARYSIWLLDEVLATAIGNGWAFKEMFNSTDDGVWYFRNKYINEASKAVASLVNSYFKDGRQMDARFLVEYITILRPFVNRWMKELDFLMLYREVRAPNFDYFEMIDRYYPNYYYRRYMVQNAINEMQPSTTKLYIFDKDNEEERVFVAKQLGVSLDSLGDFSQFFVKPILWRDKSYIILINGDKAFIENYLRGESEWFKFQEARKKRRRGI